MNARFLGCILLGFVTLVACDAPSQFLPPTEVGPSLSGGPATVTGGGQDLIMLGSLNRQGTSFSAIQTSPDDSANGRLQVILDFILGGSGGNDPDRSSVRRRCPIPI